MVVDEGHSGIHLATGLHKVQFHCVFPGRPPNPVITTHPEVPLSIPTPKMAPQRLHSYSAPTPSMAARHHTAWDPPCPLPKWQPPTSTSTGWKPFPLPFPLAKWRRSALTPRPPQVIARLRGHAVGGGESPGGRGGAGRGGETGMGTEGMGRNGLGPAGMGAAGMGAAALPPRPAALLCVWLLLGSSWGPGPPGVGAVPRPTATYVLDADSGLGRQFDGIGAVSGGGVSAAPGPWRGGTGETGGRLRSREWGVRGAPGAFGTG